MIRYVYLCVHTNAEARMAPPDKSVFINVRVTEALKAACEEAAENAHLTLPDWTRAVLALAANQGAFAPTKGGLSGTRKK